MFFIPRLIKARYRNLAAIAGALALVSSPVQAVVNIEDMYTKEPLEGFSGKVALSANGDRGNTNKSSLGAGARTQWNYERTLDFVVFNYNVGETDGERDVNNSFLHARHIRRLTETTAWEAFGQIQQNEFQRLSYRALAGGGARFTFLQSPAEKDRLIIGTGAFYEREELDDEPGTTDAGIETTTRANLYIVFNYKLNEHVRAQTTTYYQPSFDDVDNFRAIEQATLLVQLAERLDLKLQINASYNSRPPQLVERGDLNYLTGIEYRF